MSENPAPEENRGVLGRLGALDLVGLAGKGAALAGLPLRVAIVAGRAALGAGRASFEAELRAMTGNPPVGSETGVVEAPPAGPDPLIR